MSLLVILLCIIAFIVFCTAKMKLHPFFVLLLASFISAFAYGIPLDQIAKIIAGGFGGILGYIGLVIVLGTIIGIILEKSGAAITMADVVIEVVGPRFPALTMSIIGYIVSIPVFCDSGFVILNSLKESLAKRLKTSSVTMSVALATGLYATHTFVPPTPGPIAAAGNLHLEDSLGIVIMVGAVIAAIAALSGMIWANLFKNVQPDNLDSEEAKELENTDWEALRAKYGKLPSPKQAFAPIFVPIILICLGSIAKFPGHPFGDGIIYNLFFFLGQPITALLIGLFLAISLLEPGKRLEQITDRINAGILSAAPILLITGAGGAFGAVLKATPLKDYIGETFSTMGIGLFMPFLVAAALKTAQGSSTVALVTTSAILAPMLPQLGLDSEMGRVLTVMAIGAGAMTISHANDSFFWVVSQFSRMSVGLAYRAQTMATLIQGTLTMGVIYLLGQIFL